MGCHPLTNIDFRGKGGVRSYHHLVPPRAIVPVAGKSLYPKDDDNLIIHGDNLHALKSLLPKYGGRVNCIYIDPPYNTGNENWVYNDNVSSPALKEWLGKTVGSDDMERHSKWLCMMWPRLQLLRELLDEDGVIFVSIDDNEQHRLRMMMDEIFGEECFVADFVWNSTKSITNPALVSVAHTHNITYTKNAAALGRNRHNFKLPPILEGFHNPDNDPRGPWKADPFEAGGKRPNQMYPITNPQTGEVFRPKEGNCWKNDLERFKDLIRDERIVFGKSGRGRPQRKRFLSEAAERGLTPNTWWGDLGTTANATNMLKELLGPGVFPNPKPVDLLHRVVQIATKKDSIILDSFAGSGTTAHAVLELNKQDGGSRKFILVECEDYADSITAKRVRRVIQGVPGAKSEALREGTGGSFTYCELGESIDAEKMLGGEGMPSYSELAAYLLYLQDGTADGGKFSPNKQGMFHQTNKTDYYMLYEPDRDFMLSAKARLSTEQALAISNQDRRAIAFAADSELSEDDLRKLKIELVRLPYALEAAR